jgi:uncharacterized membrane protein YecN with MAPEG domain
MRADQESERLLTLWHQLSDESVNINVEKMQMRAEKFQRAIWWRNAHEYVAAGFVVVVFALHALDDASTLIMRIGAMLAVAGMLYVVWQLYRRASSKRPSPSTLADACVPFHRRELERQRDALASVWRWYLAPLVPGLIVMLVAAPLEAGRGWATAAAFFGIGALLFVGIGILNQRAARHLQDEIDALDEAAKST